ncbi:MAG: hypothetical protein AB4050_16680 [Synechococcus sp.]
MSAFAQSSPNPHPSTQDIPPRPNTSTVEPPAPLPHWNQYPIGIPRHLPPLRQPFQTQNAYLSLDSWSSAVPLRGANGDGRTRLSVLRFDREGLGRGSRQVLAGRSQVSFGLDALEATSNASDPDGQYVIWRSQAQWARSLAPSTLLVIRGSVQVADRDISPSILRTQRSIEVSQPSRLGHRTRIQNQKDRPPHDYRCSH